MKGKVFDPLELSNKMESRNRNPLQKGGAGKFRICRTRTKGFRQMKKSGDKYFRTMISHKIISEQILSINFIWQILSGNYHPRARRERIIFGFHRTFQPKMLKALQICILKHQHFITHQMKTCLYEKNVYLANQFDLMSNLRNIF